MSATSPEHKDFSRSLIIDDFPQPFPPINKTGCPLSDKRLILKLQASMAEVLTILSKNKPLFLVITCVEINSVHGYHAILSTSK